jgi:hypothetical protein
MLSSSVSAGRFRPNAVHHSPARPRQWRAVGLLMALCAAAALAYAYMHEAQANQQLRAMLKVHAIKDATRGRLTEEPIGGWPTHDICDHALAYYVPGLC